MPTIILKTHYYIKPFLCPSRAWACIHRLPSGHGHDASDTTLVRFILLDANYPWHWKRGRIMCKFLE